MVVVCVCVCVGGLWKLSCMLSFPGNLNSFFLKLILLVKTSVTSWQSEVLGTILELI